MTCNFRVILFAFITLLLGACGNNVVPISVGACGASTYPNEPCVTVTVCSPGTSQCTSIPNVLLDTGSYGLRVFSTELTSTLRPETDASGNAVAECASFADGTSEWGQVEVGDITLGGETASSVPIEVVNASYPGIPSDCTNPDTSPSQAGYNGILGVGPSVSDCGTQCTTTPNNRIYFGCSGATCNSEAVAESLQVSNPVSFMPLDNNGVLISLPTVAATGSTGITGTMYLGIGTQGNNTPASTVNVFPADEFGNFTTIFNGATLSESVMDTGSNGLFLPPTASITQCPTNSIADGMYCPSSTMSFTATQVATGSKQVSVSFQILDAQPALSTSDTVFDDLGGAGSAGSFDWGLPFFLGRNVFVAIEGKSSTLGSGPYYAY
jgi:hypothetical protein